MSRAATRLRALERRRPAAQEFVIARQDIEQPGRWLVKQEDQAAEVAYTEQQLAALPAGTTVIKVRYVDWRP